jgi:copper transport protein
MTRFAIRLLTSLSAFVAVASFNVQSASAHNTLVTSSPSDGSTLTTSPTQWTLTFDKTVPLSSASGEVVKSDGIRIPLPAPRHGDSDNVIVFDFPETLSGPNTARWRLVGTDGHVISGRVSFSIDADATPTPTNTTRTSVAASDDDGSPFLSTSRAVLRFFNYLSLLILVGLMFSNLFISPGLLSSDVNFRVASVSAYGLAVTALLQFIFFVGELRLAGSGFFGATIDAFSTTSGAMTALKATTGGVLAVLFSGRLPKQILSGPLLTISLLLFLITFAYGGHSRSEAAPWLGIPANVIHTTAMSVWLGGLGIVVFLIVPKLETSAGLMVFQKFGYVAERAVAVLSITGIVQLLRMYPNPFNVFTSAHGLLLVTKIFIVVGMIYLAAQNRTSLLSVIEDSPRQQRISRRHIMQFSLIEIVLGAAVLVTTAVMVNISPT